MGQWQSAVCQSISSGYNHITYLADEWVEIDPYISNDFCCHFARDMTDSTEAPLEEFKNKNGIDVHVD